MGGLRPRRGPAPAPAPHRAGGAAAAAALLVLAMVGAIVPLAQAPGAPPAYAEEGMQGAGIWYADRLASPAVLGAAAALTPRVGVPAVLAYDYERDGAGREAYVYRVTLGDGKVLRCAKFFDEALGSGRLDTPLLAPLTGPCRLDLPPLDGFFANRVRTLFAPEGFQACLGVLPCTPEAHTLELGRFVVHRTSDLPEPGSGGDALGAWWWGDVDVPALAAPPGSPVPGLQNVFDFAYQRAAFVLDEVFGPQQANDKGDRASLAYDAATGDWSLMTLDRGELECQEGFLFYYPDVVHMWPIVGQCDLRTLTPQDGVLRVQVSGLMANPVQLTGGLGLRPLDVRGCGEFLVVHNGSLQGPVPDLLRSFFPRPVLQLNPFFFDHGVHPDDRFLDALRRDLARDLANEIPDCSWADFGGRTA